MSVTVNSELRDFGRQLHCFVSIVQSGDYFHAVMKDGKFEWVKACQEIDAKPLFVCSKEIGIEILKSLYKEMGQGRWAAGCPEFPTEIPSKEPIMSQEEFLACMRTEFGMSQDRMLEKMQTALWPRK